MIKAVPIIGFRPDDDPTTEGIIVSCDSLVPTLKGSYKPAPSATDAGLSALSAECLGIAEAQLLDASTRLIAGTDTSLYEISGTAWVDRVKGW